MSAPRAAARSTFPAFAAPRDGEADALTLVGLTVSYRTRGRDRDVLTDVSLRIRPGEAYGLVGESGCGKSTVALAALRCLPRNGRVRAARLAVTGEDVLALDAEGLRTLRAHAVSMVYQDPASALNPSLTIARQVSEAFEAAGASPDDALARTPALLERVRIADPERVMAAYPHQLSGGMQQRVVIAMALAPNPSLLILDEPTTGLDATVEAEILALIAQLRAELGMAVLLISHDLAVIGRMCERVGVLYAGRLVEEGTTRDVFARPHHPYTVGLLRCLPAPGRSKAAGPLDTIPGELPAPGVTQRGCVYTPRCRLADERCVRDAPPPHRMNAAHGEQMARCHYHERAIELPFGPGDDDERRVGHAARDGRDGRDPADDERAAGPRGALDATSLPDEPIDAGIRDADATVGGDAEEVIRREEEPDAPSAEEAHAAGSRDADHDVPAHDEHGGQATVDRRDDAEVDPPSDERIAPAPEVPIVLRAIDVTRTFGRGSRAVRAVDRVSLELRAGETLGLVGESGSGKTTLAKLLLGLIEPDAGGRIELDGEPLAPRVAQRTARQLKALRLVFQNPDASLNRALAVRQLVERALPGESTQSSPARPDDDATPRDSRIAALLDAVRLPSRYLAARARQLSGGLKQRVAIAQAFAGEPRVVVCDEPTSALDVSVQAAILNLLARLQREHDVSYLFISHDLDVVRYLADRVAVLYAGQVVESGPAGAVFGGPCHPYTETLLAASRDGSVSNETDDERTPADAQRRGCVFRARCPHRLGAICDNEHPPFADAGEGHSIRCHIPAAELRALQSAKDDAAQR
ncbi:dipeptide ABC transporter ATP-binding protein [Paraburkholderia caballeronis]|uniref:Oligopeptide/dipeptide ABC transporter, ATP-binding protein, C-terminal domain-containing protein n=1 Tax=Paraburkholderia caballeronis TaxID=416943 RepID=A0A1H7PKK3_9BURK|nr:ABC transporter ATP-binding protein [Paraburkholderia caballeronis]PXW24222.1 oligopeptide/dipeptide ABC transporter ATP-binding protein [Paraburkholderia caballeronis]PXX00004.1 oligopeptide/dipeptide ABC transporter ATP-binding protein [Paraburkholderia caballeronis]RAJ97133.1 oligopeptide/dipeptide ABC transporter ATP-binding protein [Paraburkholderia caballeronis]SEB73308.1 oligopeptide/dipeptide ABC transporter, ATP-binding protein, C-terminal domain-containing protein [Paraburkholderia